MHDVIGSDNYQNYLEGLFDIFLIPKGQLGSWVLIWEYKNNLSSAKSKLFFNIRKTIPIKKMLNLNQQSQIVLLSDLKTLSKKRFRSKIDLLDDSNTKVFSLPHGITPSNSLTTEVFSNSKNYFFSNLNKPISKSNSEIISIPRHSRKWIKHVNDSNKWICEEPEKTIILYSQPDRVLRIGEKLFYLEIIMKMAKEKNLNLFISQHPKEFDKENFFNAAKTVRFQNWKFKKIDPLSLSTNINCVISFGSSIDFDVVIKHIPLIELHDYRIKKFKRSDSQLKYLHYFTDQYLIKNKNISINAHLGIVQHAHDYISLTKVFEYIQINRLQVVKDQSHNFYKIFLEDADSPSKFTDDFLAFFDNRDMV